MKYLFIVSLFLLQAQAYGAKLHIAVAASFKPTFEQIAAQFTTATGHTITLSSGSSGQLYAQIQHGADYDAFFSADAERPRALATATPHLGDSQNYGYGQIALYSKPNISCDNWQQTLASAQPNTVALANPKLAPYGLAAKQVLTLIDKPLTGMPLASNAAIPLNWLHSGSVKHVLSAYSFASHLETDASVCLLPAHLYSPIEQHYLALNKKPATTQLIAFAKNSAAQTLLRNNGYLVANND